jgi:predicted porin
LVAAGALATMGAAQAKPKLVVGGYVEAGIGAADNEEQLGSRVAVDVFHDNEIFFKGSIKLDNGIKIRSRTELEGQTGAGTSGHNNSNDLIDEAYVAISGKFGEIRLGSDDNAAHLMVTPYSGSWATNVGQNLNFDVADWVETPGGHRASTVARLSLGDADSEKLTYFTPRISGFRAGVSYMPAIVEGNNSSPERRTAANHEGFAVAATYDGKFDKVAIGLAAGYATINRAAGTANASEPEGFHVGGRVTFGAFRVAAGYRREWNLADNATTSSVNQGDESIDLGVRFKSGKNNFSVGYLHTEDPASRANPADDETDIIMVSYRRDLAPGTQYRLNFMWGDYEGEATGNSDDNDGIAVTTSVRMAF